jgi:hypothetical protein
MRKPARRDDIPPRRSENTKRRLADDVPLAARAQLLATVRFAGSSKHKRNPSIFGLEPFRGIRGDATLCDAHANFQPADMVRVPSLIRRGVNAGLVGTNVWTVDDNGWIYEAEITNRDHQEYHAYPVRPAESIAEKVYERYVRWAEERGNAADRQAARNCRAFYGF